MPSHYYGCTKTVFKTIPYCLTLRFPSKPPQGAIFSGHFLYKPFFFTHKYLCVYMYQAALDTGGSMVSKKTSVPAPEDLYKCI